MKYKYLGILLLLIALVVLYYTIDPASVSFFPKCVLYVTTGVYCPGCGSQRATNALLNGDVLGALQHNMLFIVGILILCYHLTVSLINTWFNKNIYNYLHHPKVPLLLLGFILIFWILRNIHSMPFQWLAPD